MVYTLNFHDVLKLALGSSTFYFQILMNKAAVFKENEDQEEVDKLLIEANVFKEFHQHILTQS